MRYHLMHIVTPAVLGILGGDMTRLSCYGIASDDRIQLNNNHNQARSAIFTMINFQLERRGHERSKNQT